MCAPTQQRTCLWPSWLRNDVKRSGNRFGRWFVRPFRQLTPAALIRRASCQGRPGAMTPKIARFLAEQQPATPCLVLDVDRVEENFRALAARAAAGAHLLRGEGQSGRAGAGAAGRPRLQLRRGELRGGRRRASTAGARAGGDQLRQHDQEGVGDPRAHSQRGVTLFAFDSAEELEKLARARAGRAGLLPHPGGERRRRLAAVAQVRHHGRERARR